MTKVVTFPKHKLQQEAKAGELITKEKQLKLRTCQICGEVGPEDVGFIRLGLQHPQIKGGIPLPFWVCTVNGCVFMPMSDVVNQVKGIRKMKKGGVILDSAGKVII